MKANCDNKGSDLEMKRVRFYWHGEVRQCRSWAAVGLWEGDREAVEAFAQSRPTTPYASVEEALWSRPPRPPAGPPGSCAPQRGCLRATRVRASLCVRMRLLCARHVWPTLCPGHRLVAPPQAVSTTALLASCKRKSPEGLMLTVILRIKSHWF